jgi:hypothetical protein
MHMTATVVQTVSQFFFWSSFLFSLVGALVFGFPLLHV